ncbi:transcription factor iiib subunit [Roseibium sp.]|uniref:transcription factor iiib subunit n=1 Tax=Roseibium sp. TaxID=1936156 RepID=UPI003BAB08D8
MAQRHQKLGTAEATRYLKAVKEAGFKRGRVIKHPDGRIELVGEDQPSTLASAPLSPFEQWEANHADTP